MVIPFLIYFIWWRLGWYVNFFYEMIRSSRGQLVRNKGFVLLNTIFEMYSKLWTKMEILPAGVHCFIVNLFTQRPPWNQQGTLIICFNEHSTKEIDAFIEENCIYINNFHHILHSQISSILNWANCMNQDCTSANLGVS